MWREEYPDGEKPGISTIIAAVVVSGLFIWNAIIVPNTALMVADVILGAFIAAAIIIGGKDGW